MTIVKSHFQLSMLLFLLTVSAMELAVSENKTSNAIDGSDVTVAVNTQTNTAASYQQQRINDIQPLLNEEQRRWQIMEAQLRAYKRYLENGKHQSSAYLPADGQSRQNEYLNQTEQRCRLIKNMMDVRRKAAQKKREIMLQKMHQTSTTSAIAEKA